MTKSVTITPELEAKFRAKFGEDADLNKFYIIKVRAISTEPIHQGTIYDGAVLSSETISAMADIVNFTNENVGVLTQHNSEKLNIGRVFNADVVDEGGVRAMYAHLAILRTDETASLIDKIDNNVLDEVSVSFTPKHAKCSMCDFDYMGEDATWEHWITQTCPEGHTIGKDGCHLEINGVKSFAEISIVNRGAATKPKILDRANYSESELKQLAASGKNPEMFVATFRQKMEYKMDPTKPENVELTAEQKIAELEAKNAEMQKALDLNAKVKSLESENAGYLEKIAVLTAENEKFKEDLEVSSKEKDAKIAELTAAKSEQEKKLTEAMSFLKKEIEKVLVASGETNLNVPEDLDGMSKLLSDRQQILASLVPAGGVSVPASGKNGKEKLVCGYTEEQLKAFQVKN